MATNWFNDTGIPKLYRCTECWELFEEDEFNFSEEKCLDCVREEKKSNKATTADPVGG